VWGRVNPANPDKPAKNAGCSSDSGNTGRSTGNAGWSTDSNVKRETCSVVRVALRVSAIPRLARAPSATRCWWWDGKRPTYMLRQTLPFLHLLQTPAVQTTGDTELKLGGNAPVVPQIAINECKSE
jgi:hypothetical protein